MLHQVNNTATVSVLVVVPGDKLHERWVQHDTGLGIEDGRAKVSLEVGRHKRLVGVSKVVMVRSDSSDPSPRRWLADTVMSSPP